MEGLPPTSATKMIDYWLILCQLVPFSQVVLLTAMEYLREEEDKVAVNAIALFEMENEEDHGPETKESWQLPQQEKRSKVLMLMVIGKYHLSLLVIHVYGYLTPQRRKFCHWQSLLPSPSTLGLLPASSLNSFLLICLMFKCMQILQTKMFVLATAWTSAKKYT